MSIPFGLLTVTDTISYDSMEAALTAAGKLLQAAEVHGIFSGLLCVHVDIPEEKAVSAVTEALLGEKDKHPLLGSLFLRTRRALEDDQFTFDLLLPEDEAPLSERAQSLAHWCQGFLYGIGLGGEQNWSEQAKEIMRDFQAISHLDPAAEGEEDERAFAELVEYVRVGAQLLFTESAMKREKEKIGGS